MSLTEEPPLWGPQMVDAEGNNEIAVSGTLVLRRDPRGC